MGLEVLLDMNHEAAPTTSLDCCFTQNMLTTMDFPISAAHVSTLF